MDRILVAEDDESIREELKTLLRANGYRTVDEPPCELALLDVNLPNESGFELCRRLRTQSSVPVIFLTARSSAEDELLGFGVGADDYIRKPYNSSRASGLHRCVFENDRRFPVVARTGADARFIGYDGVFRRAKSGTNQKRNEDSGLSDEKGAVYEGGDFRGPLEQQPLCGRKYVVCEYQPPARKLKSLGAEEFIRTVRGVGYRL